MGISIFLLLGVHPAHPAHPTHPIPSIYPFILIATPFFNFVVCFFLLFLFRFFSALVFVFSVSITPNLVHPTSLVPCSVSSSSWCSPSIDPLPFFVINNHCRFLFLLFLSHFLPSFPILLLSPFFCLSVCHSLFADTICFFVSFFSPPIPSVPSTGTSGSFAANFSNPS